MPDPKRGTAWQIDIPFFDFTTGNVRTTPTIDAGDILVRKDEGGAVNIATLPVPVGNLVPLATSAAEMTADRIYIVGHDVTVPQEWVDWSLIIDTSTSTVDDIPGLVWDVILALHLNPGSTGEALNNAATGGGGGGNVWDQLMVNHTVNGSFGWAATEVWNAMRRLKTRLGF